MELIEKQPKVFISYSWDGQARQDQIVELVQRLAADGVDTIVDIYDLKEGDDKNHFMEKMVTDTTVSHVLILCDKKYSEKANARQAGVGTESQIISQEIYSQVSQSKFIPLIYEFNSKNEAYTPIFFKSRIYIDFSSPEKENENWERLVRLLHGKPELVKPQVGKRPTYLDVTQTSNTYGMDSKFKTLKNALLSEKSNISFYRDDFLESSFSFIDSLRVKEEPQETDFAQKIIDDFKQLVVARNHLVDWCIIEAKFNHEDFSESLLTTLEKILDLSARPVDMNSWNDLYFHAHKTFAYECFLYFIATLIKSERFSIVNELVTSHYKLPETSTFTNVQFCSFEEFYYHSDYLNEKLSPPGRRLNSTIAELLKIHANREDLVFIDIMQADLIIKMLNLINPGPYWYPQTLYYSSSMKKFPFFIRAEQHKNFIKLLKITGESSKEALKEKIIAGIKLEGNRNWGGGFRDTSYPSMFNMDNWDTIK